tara:strand:- start:6972 stop:7349 length:378 start_codon:yes stop_codon:yes gene_type:complete
MNNVYRIIVAGSRGATSNETYRLLERKLNLLLVEKAKTHTIEIVSGTANGADRLGERYAEDRNYNVSRFPADWNTHGKRAGYLRNEQMAEHADALVALWDGESRGTQHMINIANEKNLPTRIINY